MYLKGIIYSFTELKRVAGHKDFKATLFNILNCISKSPCIDKAELSIPTNHNNYILIIEQINDNPDFTFRLISIIDKSIVDRYSTAFNSIGDILSQIENEIKNYKPKTEPKPEPPNAL